MTTNEAAHIRHAAHVDRDDPWIACRLAAHAHCGLARYVDYTRTRRSPAPIGDRAALRYTATHTNRIQEH